MVKNIIGLWLGLIGLISLSDMVKAAPAAEMQFVATTNHMYTFNENQPSLYSGYYPDTPELQNSCSFFQGFYLEW